MAIDLGDGYINFKANLNDLKSGLSKASGLVSSMGTGIAKTLLPSARTIKIAAAAAGTALAVAVKQSVEFDKGMREVNTLIGLSESKFRSFKNEILDLSTAMGIRASDATQALYQAISAGIPKDSATSFLEDATKLAVGGVTDLTSAVDVLTSVMNAYGIKAEGVASVNDALFTAVKDGKTTIDELSRAVFQVAPFASQAGVSLDEMLAAMAAITKVGTPTRIAATQLREAIKAITAPTDEGAQAMEAAGIQFGVTAIKAKGLQYVLNQITGAADGDQLALRKLLGSVEAMQGVLALTGSNAETFNASLVNMKQKLGAADEAFREMEEGPARTLAKIWNAVKNINVELGNFTINVFDKLFGSRDYGEAFLGFLQSGINKLREMSEWLDSQAGALWAWNMQRSAKSVWEAVKESWESIKEKTKEIFDGLKVEAAKLWESLKDNWEKIKRDAIEAFTAVAGVINDVKGAILDMNISMQDIYDTLGVLAWLVKQIGFAFLLAWTFMKVWNLGIQEIRNALDSFFDTVGKAWHAFFSTMNESHMLFFEKVGKMWADNIDQWKRAITGFFSWYESASQSFIDKIGVGWLAERMGNDYSSSSGGVGVRPSPEIRTPRGMPRNEQGSAEANFGQSGITINVSGGNPSDVVAAVRDAMRRGDLTPQGAM